MRSLLRYALGTDNDLASDEGYEHISCFQPISQSVLFMFHSLFRVVEFLQDTIAGAQAIIRDHQVQQHQ